jgi:hypothetical protein
MSFGPITGISFVISLFVVLIGAVMRPLFFLASAKAKSFLPQTRSNKPVLAITMVASIFIIYAAIATLVVVETTQNSRTSMLAFASTLIPCDEVTVETGTHNVILRLDDVQAYGWADISMRMMDDSISRDMPIVAGVIPKGIEEDFQLVRFLEKEACNIEFALHGYDHGAISDFDEVIGEFEKLNYDDANRKLGMGIDEIKHLVESPIVTFIPPQNRISVEATAALEQHGLFLSKSGNGYYDYDAKTWNYDENIPVSATDVIKICDETFASGDDLCVIMLHPQDFLDDQGHLSEEKYQEYIKLLDLIKASEFSTVRFSDMIALHSKTK